MHGQGFKPRAARQGNELLPAKPLNLLKIYESRSTNSQVKRAEIWWNFYDIDSLNQRIQPSESK
jgi:hypothetical protein